MGFLIRAVNKVNLCLLKGHQQIVWEIEIPYAPIGMNYKMYVSYIS